MRAGTENMDRIVSMNATDGVSSDRQGGADSQERLMGIIASATDAIITVDADQKVTVFNAAAERMFRCPASQAVGKPLDQFIPPRFRSIHGQHIHLFGEAGITTRPMGEQRPIVALRADGVEFPVEATISQITVAGQKLFTAIVRDISERKRAEDALRESEGRLRSIVETAVDGIITIDERGRISSFNPAATRIFGYTPDEVMGKNVNMLMPAPYHEEHDGYLSNYRNTGIKKIIGIGREVIGLRKDGSQFPMDLAVSETLLGDRRIFTGIVREITERKQAEAGLRESEGRLRAIVETAVDGIITIDERGRVTSFNPAATRLFGYTPEEVMGKTSTCSCLRHTMGNTTAILKITAPAASGRSSASAGRSLACGRTGRSSRWTWR
jgi:PAS domain S-box-containing protein